ncbi:MAG: pitrilysin family protein, partial [Chloroflexi bacterium]|nr:pitrilysin family protein [Chloroflexota bacterium]
VAAIQRDDLIQHIDRWYRPERMVLAVAGNVDPEHVFALAEAEWSGQEARATGDLEPAQPEMAADRVLVEQRDIELCNVGIALRTFKRTDPDRYALSLLNEVLGRGMSSRLFLEVRERRGLAYSVGSGTARFSDTGHLSVGAGVTRENVEETVEVVLAELDRLVDEAVGDEELAKAREHAIGSFRLSLETASSWAHRTGESLLAEDKIRSPEEIVELFRGVTADDVRRVARRFIRRDNVAISVVGPYDSPQALQAMIG